MRMQPMLLCLVLMLSLVGGPTADAELLPRPAGLEDEVGFWHDIFTRYSSAEGVIHDDRHLGVVYGVIEIPEGASRKKRKRLYDSAASEFKASLTRLANRGENQPQGEDARILSLWPEGVSSEELLLARTRLRMQQGLSDRFFKGVARSGKWREHIVAALQREAVPVELVALPHVESSFNPEAYSHAGASGMWQFTRSTGKRFMRVDHIVDERRDPFASSDAAARLLKYNYSILKSWPLAITAYNHGVSGMRRAVKQIGSDDIERVIHEYNGSTFRFASRNFYVAFLAALQADREAIAKTELASPQKDTIVEIPYFVPAQTLSEVLGLPLNTLQAFNSALMAPVWDGSKYVPRGFGLRVPTGRLQNPSTTIAAIPEQYRFRTQVPDEYHKVKRGETLSGIARRYKTSVSRLLALNGVNNRHRIYAGRTLRLPTPENMRQLAAAPKPASDMIQTAEGLEKHPANVDALLADPSDYQVNAAGQIVVQAEETLGHYADWLELTTQRLRNLNKRPVGKPIHMGQRIKLDFGKVAVAEFVKRRVDYHRSVQQSFFSRFRVSGEKAHVVKSGDTLWTLTRQRFSVPQWLLRQYNPGIDFARLKPGTRLVIPQLQAVVSSAGAAATTLARE